MALREVLEVPVVSISEASMALACQLGHRFSCLTMLQQFIPYQEDLVRLFGFEAKCASVRAININVEAAAQTRKIPQIRGTTLGYGTTLSHRDKESNHGH